MIISRNWTSPEGGYRDDAAMSAQCPAPVKDILSPGDSCVAWLEAGLVQEWVKTGRLLLLVRHTDTAHG